MRKVIYERQKYYQPCRNGFHVCGSKESKDWPFTVRNFPMSQNMAKQIFPIIKRDFGIDHADTGGDLSVDFCDNGDINEEFSIKRQMLEPMARRIEVLTSTITRPKGDG